MTGPHLRPRRLPPLFADRLSCRPVIHHSTRWASMKLSNLVLIALAMPLLSACSAGGRTLDLQPGRGGTPRDRHGLEVSRSASRQQVADWEAAASRALRSGLHIDASFRERV